VEYELIIIRYGEIALKAKYTRKYFENILIKNIKNALKLFEIENKIIKEWGRLYIKTNNIAKSIIILKKIFGITSISPAIKIKTDITTISDKIINITKNKLSKNNSFALRVKRVGNHNFTSQNIAVNIGNCIVKKTGSNVNLTNPNYVIFIDIRYENTYIFFNKIQGMGGFPIGTQGNVLAIISDKKSILASWYLIRRGCKVIFYLKNIKQNNNLNSFCNKWFIEKNIYIKNEKSKIIEIIEKENCQAIITSHNINKESDSINDIKKIKNKYNLPVLCPLIIMNKKEIKKKLNEIEF
jgi:thiamine biosynthesis protein ThiI